MEDGLTAISAVAINEWAMLAIVITICAALAALLWWSGSGDDGAT